MKNGCVLFEGPGAVVAGLGVAGVTAVRAAGCGLVTGAAAAAAFADFWPFLPFAESGAGVGKGKTLWFPLNIESTELPMRALDSSSCAG